MEKKKESKGLFSNLVEGNWVDNVSGSWGKPKSFNPDWYKDPREAKTEAKAEVKTAKKKVVINGKTYVEE